VGTDNPTSPGLTGSWRAGCGESRTSGSEERHGETTERKLGTAPHVDSYVVRIAPDGLPEWIPPAWLDPHQRPRRNTTPHHDPFDTS
jgi:hypothetical protein